MEEGKGHRTGQGQMATDNRKQNESMNECSSFSYVCIRKNMTDTKNGCQWSRCIMC